MYEYLICFICPIFLLTFGRAIKRFLRTLYLSQNFVGPQPLPLLGNANLFYGAKPEDVLLILRKIAQNYGKTVKLWFGQEFSIFFFDTKDMEIILGTSKLLTKSMEYDFLKKWLCEGLLLSKPSKWIKRRKILTPAFHFYILEQYIEIFDRNSGVFIKNLQKAGQNTGGIIDFDHWINLATLDVICASPPSWPIVGHGHYFMFKEPHELLQKILYLSQTYIEPAKVMKIWLGPELNLLTADLKDVEIILGGMTHLDKAGEYKALEPWLREGLLISRGRKWHQRRKVLTPAFHFTILQDFIETFENESRILLENMSKEYKMQSKDGFNFYEWINLCTLDAICESAMGVSVNAQTNADSDYVKAVKTISTVLHKRMFDILYRFNLTYKFTKLARDEKKAISILHGFTEKIIIQRREELLKAQEKAAQQQTNDVGSKRKMAFLDILLQSEIDGKPLSNLDIREEVDTFMFEGHDTTSSAITFCFYNLALYPECQQKCFEEIVQVFGKDKSKPVTYEDLNNLPYVELCIKETLRLFPSVPLLGRKVTEECEINGKIIPAGTNIGISPLHLGRQEDLFPEANKFKPERFLTDYSADKLSPYAYIPFSAGPRNCIGQKFAMLEIKTVLANVLRHYEIDYAGNKEEELLLIAELILRPKDPLMFKIKPRVY